MIGLSSVTFLGLTSFYFLGVMMPSSYLLSVCISPSGLANWTLQLVEYGTLNLVLSSDSQACYATF